MANKKNIQYINKDFTELRRSKKANISLSLLGLSGELS